MGAVSGPGQGDDSHPKKRLKALTEFILGEGLQPPESLISIVCEAFGCTPDVAVTQDMALVRRILDVRMMEGAKAQHNQDASKMSEAQTELWMEAMEALNG